jgi:hypothetical protein
MSNLRSRIRKLEARTPKQTESPKSGLPEWLLEALRPEGLRWDSRGRIDRESLRAITGCGRTALQGKGNNRLTFALS